MSDSLFHVVCTGRGEHGRIDWPDVVLGADGSTREVLVRQGPLAAGKTGRKAMVPTDSHRSAKGTWRWKCPRCRIDLPLSEGHLRAWMDISTTDVLDISKAVQVT